MKIGTKMPTLASAIVVVLLIFGFDKSETISAVEDPGHVVDIDGNSYKTVRIGSQVWMAENLKTTRLNDGTPIIHLPSGNQWKDPMPPAYCWLNNDSLNKQLYGALYNWYAVETKKLAPPGWHVPSASDFKILIDHMGGESVAGAKLAESGFRAQGAGQFSNAPAAFNLFLQADKYWTSTTGGWEPTDARYCTLTKVDSQVSWSSHPMCSGHSIRCVRN